MHMHAPPALYICKYIDVHTHTNDIPTPPLQHGVSHVHNTRTRTQDKETTNLTHTHNTGGCLCACMQKELHSVTSRWYTQHTHTRIRFRAKLSHQNER